MGKNRRNRLTEDEVGNTKTSSTKPSKQDSAAKHWCFTFNNYVCLDNLSEIDAKVCKLNFINLMETELKKICCGYIFQSEIGEDTGTLHLQGYMITCKDMRLTELKKSLDKGIHFEKRKGTKKAAIDYCCKDETKDMQLADTYFTFGTITLPKKPCTLNIINILRPWQKSLCDIIEGPINDRSIHWVFDSLGNNGKTVFCKYLYVKYQALLFTGGAVGDISCSIALAQKSGKDLNDKNTFVFNFPRSTERISYKAIESCKDGLLFSKKYESSCLVFNNPHLICFSNEMPNSEMLSSDRWIYWVIKNNELVPYSIIEHAIYLDNLELQFNLEQN